jgi:hypothetical protein
VTFRTVALAPHSGTAPLARGGGPKDTAHLFILTNNYILNYINGVSKPEYETAIVAINVEIVEVLAKRHQLSESIAGLDQRLTQLKATHDALTTLLGAAKITQVRPEQLSDEATTGISDALRRILKASLVPMRPGEIKLALMDRGFDLSGYVNAAAVVYNTLLRLEKQGEVYRVNNGWVSANPGDRFAGRGGEMLRQGSEILKQTNR